MDALQEDDTLDGEGEAAGQLPHRNEAGGGVRITHTCPSGNLETFCDMRCGKLQHRILYNVLKTKSYTAIYTHIGSKFKV